MVVEEVNLKRLTFMARVARTHNIKINRNKKRKTLFDKRTELLLTKNVA